MEEQETPPKVSLGPASIDFGAVGYLRSVTKTLEVKNIGKVSENYRHMVLLPIWFQNFTHGRTLDTLRVLVRACGGRGTNLCVCPSL